MEQFRKPAIARRVPVFRRRRRKTILHQAGGEPAWHLPPRVGRAGCLVPVFLHWCPAPRRSPKRPVRSAGWATLPLACRLVATRFLHWPRHFGCCTRRRRTACLRSPRAWSATSATTRSAESNVYPTRILEISTFPSWPSCSLPTLRCWTTTTARWAGRERHQLRRHRRARGRGICRLRRQDRCHGCPTAAHAPWSPRLPSTDPFRCARQRTAEEYQAAVRSAVEEIRAGEAFQIVVSQRFEVDTTAEALDIYQSPSADEPQPVHVPVTA